MDIGVQWCSAKAPMGQIGGKSTTKYAEYGCVFSYLLGF
jgi:hypothetical protein